MVTTESSTALIAEEPPRSRARLAGAALIVLSLLPALLCVAAFAVQVPYDTERYRDYTAAVPCPADLPVRARQNCLRTVPFTVEKAQVDERKRPSYVATLSGAPFWNGTLDFGDPGPLLEQLRPGDQVTGTVWRGDITALAKDSVRQDSADAPRDEAQMMAGLGTLAGLVAALGLWFGAVRLTPRPRGHEPYTWRSLGKPLLITISVLCAAVAFGALLLGIPWWVVPTVAVPLAAFTAWQFDRYRRQQSAAAGDARHSTLATEPTRPS
ncbi:hypothetical protein ACFWBN_28100 [Streptomyces sp. NPDC059989]|uniref:hypothetical protein n=1 Tax=Streptomyces sp. NPDC059989 TaxID=3347026 RepID=UPI00368E1FFA